ncbi:MAG: vWA domain-containing protein [Thermodesulfobacteriota bacterium]
MFLFLIIPFVILLFLYSCSQRSKTVLSFADKGLISKITYNYLKKQRFFSDFLAVSGLVLIILAAAGPVTGYKKSETKTKGLDIVFALDASKSMLCTDIKPSRIKRAKHEISNLVNRLEGDRAGLVVFGGEAFVHTPLTVDLKGFDLLLDAVDPATFPAGGTDLYKAVMKSVSLFDEKSPQSKAVILISDGEKNQGTDPAEASVKAKDNGIKIFSFALGSKDGAPVPLPEGGYLKDENRQMVISRKDPQLLKKIALESGGEFYDFTNRFDMYEIYKDNIREKADLAQFESSEKREKTTPYKGLTLAALISVFLSFILRQKTDIKSIIVLILFFIVFPNDLQALSAKEKGQNLYKNKDYNKAFEVWTKDQINNPDNLKLYYNIGNAAYKKKDLDTAQKNYEKVIESEKTTKNMKYNSVYNLGNVYLLKNKPEKAIENYEKYLKEFPDDKDALKNLKIAKSLQKDNENKNKEQKNKDSDKEKKDKSENEMKKKGDDKKSENSLSEDAKKKKAQNSGENEKKIKETKKNQKSPYAPDHNDTYDIFNKVKDQPRGLIPYYKKKESEKDW